MLPELAAGGLLGLIGSLHCAQMCGPIVLAISLNGQSNWKSHLAYQTGRITTYALLGAIAGAFGSSLTWLFGAEQKATLAAGVLLILAGGVFAWTRTSSKDLIQIQMPGRLSRLSARMLRTPGWRYKSLLGLAMGFLPCGMIYAALVQAAAVGSAAAGAVVMAAFGLATSWSLLAIGGLAPSLAKLKWVKYTSLLTSITLVLMGSILLWRGYSATSPAAAEVHPHSCHEQQQHTH
jgi:sulfite exporter TauE/SafE